MVQHAFCLREKLIYEFGANYTYSPAELKENANNEVYWDVEIRTDWTIPDSRTDEKLHQKKEKRPVLIIDFTVTLDNNIKRAHNEKIDKDQKLAREIKD